MTITFACRFNFSDKLWAEKLREAGGDRNVALEKLHDLIDMLLRDEGVNQAQVTFTEVTS
jgi:hypothetical protein